jgi:membrane carboxypeptidase/penicillin-binding protein PbpC
MRQTNGSQFNMATEPRPIGSTIKPFIYARGFEKGLRPYSLVDDREYRFTVDSGFPLYPKNYDGKYRGIVTLQSALANSLNVPSVKILEYITLEDFYALLSNAMQFQPVNELDSYQYGIALGGLEMDPLTLAHLYTVFPHKGMLKPLTLILDQGQTFHGPMTHVSEPQRVFDAAHTELVTKILSDRTLGVEQFGLASNLHLSQSNAAVKTGTSRDFHDSWTVGYTPDFVVVAWLGNAENRPLKQITGASGAGSIWNNAMEILFQTPYNAKTPFSYEHATLVAVDDSYAFGLHSDDPIQHQKILLSKDLIIAPQHNDLFSFSPHMEIFLRSHEYVKWYANKKHIGEGQSISFHPEKAGSYTLRATNTEGESHSIRITILP